MARLLVVSRSMALALRLADTHDVVEASVDHLATLHPSPDVDAVVLDVGEPALAVQTIDRLRRDGDTTPLLVVSGYQAAWAGLTAIDVPGVVVVPLPVTRAALLEGIDRLLAAARSTGLGEPELDPATGGWRSGGFDWWDDAAGPARPAGPEALPVTAAGSAAAPSPAAPGAGGEPAIGAAPAPAPDGPGTSAVAAAPRTPSAEARAAEPRATRHRPEPRVLDLSDGAGEVLTRPLRRGWPPQPPAAGAAGPSPTRPATAAGAPGTIGPDGVAGAQPAPGHPAAAPGHSGRAPDHPGPAAEPEPVPDAATLVEALVSRTAQLLGVTDAARAVADQTAGSARAAACAVLVPDGAGWRVSGGHGLRAAERSLVLEASHWLVEALQSADRPILLQSSDLARRPGGVPLASWRHLLVAPVPRTRVFIVLARAGDDEPFGPEDVHALAGPLTRAAPMLRAAMQVRHLARLLAPLRDVPPGP